MKWYSFHIFCHDFSLHDKIILTIQKYCKKNNLNNWFFMRYWEGGPHIRLRIYDKNIDIDDLENCVKKVLNSKTHLTKKQYYQNNKLDGEKIPFQKLPWYPDNSIQIIPYIPEVDRYGGERFIKFSEDIFHISSELACSIIQNIKKLTHKIYIYIYIYSCLFNQIEYLEIKFDKKTYINNCSEYWEKRYGIIKQEQFQLIGEKFRLSIVNKKSKFKDLYKILDSNILSEYTEKNIKNITEINKTNQKLARSVLFSQMHMLANRLSIPIEYEYCIYNKVLIEV